MKFSKILLGAVVLAVAFLCPSCKKDDGGSSTNLAELTSSFTTTEDIDDITVRQYVVLINGQTVLTKNISGTSFSDNDQILNFAFPSTIDVQVVVSILPGAEIPETIKVKDGYNVTCGLNDDFSTYYDAGITGIISRSELSDYIGKMNHSFYFTVDAYGKIHKAGEE